MYIIQEYMIKITYYFLLTTFFSMAFSWSANNSANEANWLNIVQKRLELEQKPVDDFLNEAKPEKKKSALDNALLFYKKEFNELYNEIMSIFQESDDWLMLRQYLMKSNKALEEKYNQLNEKYLVKQGISQKELESYESDLESYYKDAMEMFKKVITEGQTKEVKLRKEEIQELKKERRKKPGVESSIWTEED